MYLVSNLLNKYVSSGSKVETDAKEELTEVRVFLVDCVFRIFPFHYLFCCPRTRMNWNKNPQQMRYLPVNRRRYVNMIKIRFDCFCMNLFTVQESCKQDATLLAADGDGLKVNGTGAYWFYTTIVN